MGIIIALYRLAICHPTAKLDKNVKLLYNFYSPVPTEDPNISPACYSYLMIYAICTATATSFNTDSLFLGRNIWPVQISARGRVRNIVMLTNPNV